MISNSWNATLYDSKHYFVSQYGESLLEILSPMSGESILDLGCGTGHLANQMAQKGVNVIGVDSSKSMIEQASSNYPQLKFTVEDATNLPFREEFDAVFSNAVLHWVKEPEKAIASIYQALKPGGRFVAEFGGKGNVEAIFKATQEAMQELGIYIDNPWYFPSIGEYSSLLEQQGFEVAFAMLFERPTPLEGEQGIRNWIEMFGKSFLAKLSAKEQENLFSNIEQSLRPTLYRDETWIADYKRIRVLAIKQ